MRHPLQRDSANGFTITLYKESDRSIADVSGYDIRLEFYMDGTCVSLTLGSGISFVTDGTDGQIAVNLTKAQTNQFCIGQGRLRAFDDSGVDPICFNEGSFYVEGKKYDA